MYGLKQAGRRWVMHLGDVINRKIEMEEQCKADPCVCRLIRDGIVMTVCVHVDDITVAGKSSASDFISTCLLEEFQPTGVEVVVTRVRV